MNILVSGGSGFIGQALIHHFLAAGHTVTQLIREQTRSHAKYDQRVASWNPEKQLLHPDILRNADVIINLAGSTIATRWTNRQKEILLSSRVQTTSLIAKTLKDFQICPKLFLSASAVGYYGDTATKTNDENTPRGEGFLARLTQEWEQASAPATEVTRVVNARLGIVLAKGGGALAKLLPVFRFGLGGRLGSGLQYMSWIAIADVVSAIEYCISNDHLVGPTNFVSPNPVTNLEFTKALARALHRPAFFPVPKKFLTVLLGEMAEETLFASTRVVPTKLLNNGFLFLEPDLLRFLEHECSPQNSSNSRQEPTARETHRG